MWTTIIPCCSPYKLFSGSRKIRKELWSFLLLCLPSCSPFPIKSTWAISIKSDHITPLLKFSDCFLSLNKFWSPTVTHRGSIPWSPGLPWLYLLFTPTVLTPCHSLNRPRLSPLQSLLLLFCPRQLTLFPHLVSDKTLSPEEPFPNQKTFFTLFPLTFFPFLYRTWCHLTSH
jgi:hypothetical protein